MSKLRELMSEKITLISIVLILFITSILTLLEVMYYSIIHKEELIAHFITTVIVISLIYSLVVKILSLKSQE